MHYRKKHPTGKPQLNKNSSDWSYPLVEKGTVKHSRYSVAKAAARFNQRLKEYYNGPIVHR